MNCANCGGGLRPVGNRNYFRCPYCETFHFPDETDVNIITVDATDPKSGTAEFKATAVRVDKLPAWT